MFNDFLYAFKLLIFQGKFDFDISAPHIFKFVNKSMADRYSNNRYYCHQYFKMFATITEARRHPYRKICQEDWNGYAITLRVKISRNFSILFYYLFSNILLFFDFEENIFHEGKRN